MLKNKNTRIRKKKKKFTRRATQRGLDTECKVGGKCSVTHSERADCPACRYYIYTYTYISAQNQNVCSMNSVNMD